VQCSECLQVLSTVSDAVNSPIGTKELLERTAKSMVEQLGLKACHFRLLSRDQRTLEHITSVGLSEEFLNKGPIAAERSVAQALEGHIVAIEDCGTDSRIQYPAEHAKEGLVSCLTVPLLTRGQAIGVIRLYTGERRTFSDVEQRITEVIAAFCARAVTHSMFHHILDNVTDSIRSSLEVHKVLEEVAKKITEDLRIVGCAFHLLDSEGSQLKDAAAYGLSKSFLRVLATQPGSGIQAALEGTCTQLVDPREEEPTPFIAEVIKEGISSILYVPLMIRDKAIGVLSVCTHLPYPLSEDETYFMKAIGDQCGLAIQHSRMYAMVRQNY
jgi:GAF domain-containing protein